MLQRSVLRRSYAGVSYRPRFRGYYPEDHTNDYSYHLYWHPRERKKWYAQKEVDAVREWADERMRVETLNHHEGRAPNGDGAFERDMQRKGVQVEKYPLPSTVATRRLHEMVLLRRQALSAKSVEAMARQRDAKRRDVPSGWYDEADGPLNPNFLRFAQASYAEQVTDLPEEPIAHADIAGKVAPRDTSVDA